MDNNFIQHHGVVGQKWGVRRYQTASGRITSEGKKHIREQAYDQLRNKDGYGRLKSFKYSRKAARVVNKSSKQAVKAEKKIAKYKNTDKVNKLMKAYKKKYIAELTSDKAVDYGRQYLLYKKNRNKIIYEGLLVDGRPIATYWRTRKLKKASAYKDTQRKIKVEAKQKAQKKVNRK